jgi:hypothetical protein
MRSLNPSSSEMQKNQGSTRFLRRARIPKHDKSVPEEYAGPHLIKQCLRPALSICRYDSEFLRLSGRESDFEELGCRALALIVSSENCFESRHGVDHSSVCMKCCR